MLMTERLGVSEIINRIFTAFERLRLEERHHEVEVETWSRDYPMVQVSWFDDGRISRNAVAHLPEGPTGKVRFEVNAWKDERVSDSEATRRWWHEEIGESGFELPELVERALQAYNRAEEIEQPDLRNTKDLPNPEFVAKSAAPDEPAKMTKLREYLGEESELGAYELSKLSPEDLQRLFEEP